MGLLENLLAKILSDHAGEFLKVSKEQLSASLSGEITLTAIEVRCDAINRLMGNLPIALRSARIGSLKAKIPWDHLSTRSVRIALSNVEIVIEPQAVDKNAPGDSWMDVVKRQRLAASEVLMQEQLHEQHKKPPPAAAAGPAAADSDSDPDEADEPQKRTRMSLLQRIVARVADNLIVTIENLIVRFEDAQTLPSNKFALSLHLEALSLSTDAASTGTAFVDRTVKPPPSELRRRLHLRGLSVSWERLGGGPSKRRHLVRPFGLSVALTQHLAPTTSGVDVSLDCKCEGVVAVMLDTDEYRDLAVLTERVTAHESFVTQSAIWRMRPAQSPLANPRGWWHYAIRAVQTVLRSSSEPRSSVKSSWPQLIKQLKTRRRYIHFYKQRLVKADAKFLARASKLKQDDPPPGALTRHGSVVALTALMDKAELADSTLQAMELELPFNTIMLFRAFAEAEFREERARLRKLHRSKRMAARALQAGRKMMANLRFPSSSNLQAAPSSGPADPASWSMEPKEKLALYRAVTEDPSTAWLIEKSSGPAAAASSSAAQSSVVHVHVEIPLVLVSLSLSPAEPIMDIGLGGISLALSLGGPKQTRYAIDARLQTLEFVDKTPHEHDDFRGIPGILRTLSDEALLVMSLSSSSSPSSTTNKETIRVVAEIRPVDITLSLTLIARLAQLTKVTEVASLAPATMERMRQLGRATAMDLNKVFAKVLDIKVEWDMPNILVPLYSEQQGRAVGLDLQLGRLRLKSQPSHSQLLAEWHGVHGGLRRLEKTSLTQWKALDASTIVSILHKFDVDAKLVGLGQPKFSLVLDVSPVALRLDPGLLQGLASASRTLQMPASSQPSLALDVFLAPFSALQIAVPKLEVVLVVPRHRHGLRVKRPCWGADSPDDSLLPASGALKLRLANLALGLGPKGSGLAIKLEQLSVRDEVQCAGPAFRDLLHATDIAIDLAQRPGAMQVAVRMQSNLVLAWNPSTVDALADLLVKALLARGPVASNNSSPPPASSSALFLSLSMPGVFIHLNQETIGSRLAIVRVTGIALSVQHQRLSASIADVNIQGVQWEPLTATTGVQLLGRGLEGDDDAGLPSNENLLEVEVSLKDPVVHVTFEARHVRFLWVHTLTKQVADYMSDGVSGLLKAHLALLATGAPTYKEGKLAVLVQGKVFDAAVAVPNLRFGKAFRYKRGGNADEIVATVQLIDFGVSVFDSRPPPLGDALYRADDHLGPGTDASFSNCALPPTSRAALGYQDPSVEIRMVFSGVDVTCVHRQLKRANSMAKGIAGKLAWHIVDFTPAQKTVRAQQTPLTAREKARMDADIRATGGAIPFGEHPHGVSPQKFELAVDADNLVLTMTIEDIVLFGSIVLNNILDHRRRLARVPAPRLPLFLPEETLEPGNEFGAGSDELVSSSVRPETAVQHAHASETLPPALSPEQVDYDARGFAGLAPPFVDLDLSLRFPNLAVVVMANDASVARLSAKGFEMTLTELYDRTQYVDIGLQQVLVDAPQRPSSGRGVPSLRRSATEAAEHVVLLEAGEPRKKIFGNPSVSRTRTSEVMHTTTWSQVVRNDWKYARSAPPIYILVTRWPAKDRRVEVGVNQVDINPDVRSLLQLTSAIRLPAMPPSIKVTRAEILELHVSKFAVRWRRPMTEPELVVKGCAKVVFAANRAGKKRVLVETRLGVGLRTTTNEIDAGGSENPSGGSGAITQQHEDKFRASRPSAPIESPFDLLLWLEAVYREHNPVKLAEAKSIVHAFDGHHDELVDLISAKYNLPPESSSSPHGAKHHSSPLKSKASTFRRHEAAIFDPFGVRVDVSVGPSSVEIAAIVESIVGRLTNGQVEACRAVALAAIAASGPPSRSSSPPLPVMPSLAVTAVLQGGTLTLINDYGSSHSIPLVRVCLSGLAVRLNRLSRGSEVADTLSLQVIGPVAPRLGPGESGPKLALDSFNPRILAWESLVEPCSLSFDCERVVMQGREVKRLVAKVDFDKGLNVNFTFAFVESFAYWLACRAARRRGHLDLGSRMSEHYIVNDSGRRLVFWADDCEEYKVVLEVGERAGLRLGGQRPGLEQGDADLFQDTRAGLKVGSSSRQQSLSLMDELGSSSRQPQPGPRRVVGLNLLWESVPGFALHSVPIQRFGTFVYPVEGDHGPSKVTMYMSLEHGSKVVRVLSPVQLRNATAAPLHVLLTSPEGSSSLALGPLQPGDAAPVPIDCLSWSFCYHPVMLPQPMSGVREKKGPSLDLEAAKATSNAADALGYTWSAQVCVHFCRRPEEEKLTALPRSMLDIHKLVGQPTRVLCPRTRAFTYEGRGRAKSEEGVGAGGEYMSASCLGVESFASSDSDGLRETYVVTVLPLVKVENRLPVGLLVRSLRKEGEANLPISGHSLEPGADADLTHVVSAPLRPSPPASPSASPRASEDLGEGAVAPLLVTLTVPGLGWSPAFVPGSLGTVVLSQGPLVRLCVENERTHSGSVRMTVFAETWLVNEARLLMNFREGAVGGETLINEIGSRGGQAAHLIYELGHTLRERAFRRTNTEGVDLPAPEEEEQEEDKKGKLVLFSEGRFLALRADEAGWSSALTIDAVGTHRDVVLQSPNDERLVVSMAIRLAPGKFRRSRVVVFYPRLVVVNHVPGYMLKVASMAHKRPVEVRTGEHAPLHWFDSPSLLEELPDLVLSEDSGVTTTRVHPLLVVALASQVDSWGWSGGFRVCDSGTMALKVHSRHSGETRVLRVHFSSKGPTTRLLIENESNAHPMYRVLNQSDEVIHYYQPLQSEKTLVGAAKRSRGVVERVFRGESKVFGWDEPNQAKCVVALSFRGDLSVHECAIDALSAPAQIVLPATKSMPAKSLWVSVRIRGTTKTLLVAETGELKSPTPPLVSDEPPPISLSVFAAQIGLSLVDRAPQELLLMTLSQVRIECARKPLTVELDEVEAAGLDSLDVSVHLVQIDNQLATTHFPVMLGPAKGWVELADRPHTLQLSLVRRYGHAAGVDFFEFASVQTQEMDLKIDDTILLLLGRMVWECVMSLRSEEELVVGEILSKEGPASRLKRWLLASEAPPLVVKREDDGRSELEHWLDGLGVRIEGFNEPSKERMKRAYFKLLHLQGIKLNLSFRFTASDPRAVLSLSKFRSSGSLRGDDFSEGVLGRPALFDVDSVAAWLPPALINIDNARLRLQPLYAPHLLVDREQLLDTVARHYSQQALYQIYRVIGSSDLIGNPLGVLRDIGAGLEDFVSRPLVGIAKASPLLFVQGLGSGTFSLIKHAALGSFDLLSKATGAVGAGVALLTLDHRFISQRWTRLRFEQPGHAGAGLAMGLRALVNAVVEGWGGLVIGPVRELLGEGSVVGFVRELGLGVVGFGIKPVVGLLDLASRASTGLRNSVEKFDGKLVVAQHRRRLPRAFKGAERRLDAFVLEEAFVADLLKQLEDDESGSFDYLAHVVLHGSFCLVAGGGRLWCLDYDQSKRRGWAGRQMVVWYVPLTSVVDVVATAEPAFPQVRVRVKRPSDFCRVRPRDGMHGAQDCEFIVRGGGPEEDFRAEVVVGLDTHERARLVSEVMCEALFKRRGGVVRAGQGEDPAGDRRVLGFALGPLPAQMKDLAGPGHVGGAAVVIKVVKGSPADKAGMKEGDVLLRVDDVPLEVGDVSSLVKKAAAAVPAREVKMTLVRARGRVVEAYVGTEE